MFFCEFCEISKNTFLHRTPLVAASVDKESTKLREFRGNVTWVAWVKFLRALRGSNIFYVGQHFT